MKQPHLPLRCATLAAGLFVMALGVALSVKASLGVSPISCIPYVYSVRFPLSMGATTIVFNVLLILLQIAVLGRAYKPFQLVQLPVVFLFGAFTDLALYLTRGLHAESYAGQLGLCLASCAVIGFGVFVEVKAKVTYLAGEGLALALAERFKAEFGKAKITTDCSMVTLGVISSFLLLGRLAGLREGTLVAAVVVGYLARFYCRKLTFLDALTRPEAVPEATTTATVSPAGGASAPKLVIAISREFGSGGREIGRLLAERLGIPFYDKEIIRLTAEKSGFTPEYIKAHEQRLANALLFSLYEQNYAYVDEQRPPLEALFLIQSKIIREIGDRESCVIVGRCANYVLKDRPGCFSVFVHADPEFRRARYLQEFGGSPDAAAHELEQLNHDRDNYSRHYTGRERGRAQFYDLCLDSSRFGIEGSAELILGAVKRKTTSAQ